MDETTRTLIIEALRRLADSPAWDPELWQQCYDLVAANQGNELLAYVYDDMIHYSGEFHSRNLFGFRTKPHAGILEDCRYEFRSVADALRDDLSLPAARKKYDI